MSAEREVVRFEDHSLTGAKLLAHGTHATYQLPQLQADYMKLLTQGLSVEKLVHKYLAEKSLVSFKELHNLIELLIREKIILSPSWREEFEPHKMDPTLLNHPAENKLLCRALTSTAQRVRILSMATKKV